MRAADRREQHDRWRLWVDRLAILCERKIVEAPALECDRAGQSRRLDAHPRRLRERFLACQRLGGRLDRDRCAWCRRCPRCGRGGRILGWRNRLLLRHPKPELPADQNDRRQQDEQEGVFLIVHLGARSRRKAWSKSWVIRSKGSDSADRRPTNT